MSEINELHWAAGFFDGEGHCGLQKQANGCAYLRLQVGQSDRRPLDRFLAAVGVGKIYGPYDRKKYRTADPKNWKPHFVYSAFSEDAGAVLKLLYPLLSEPKQEQARSAIENLERIRSHK